jgi:hypothetical protein
LSARSEKLRRQAEAKRRAKIRAEIEAGTRAPKYTLEGAAVPSIREREERKAQKAALDNQRRAVKQERKRQHDEMMQKHRLAKQERKRQHEELMRQQQIMKIAKEGSRALNSIDQAAHKAALREAKFRRREAKRAERFSMSADSANGDDRAL